MMQSRLRAFLEAVWSDSVALVSGAGSFVLAFLGAFLNYAWSPRVFGPLGYVCFWIAAYRLWAQQYIKVQELESRLSPANPEEETFESAKSLAAEPPKTAAPMQVRLNIQHVAWIFAILLVILLFGLLVSVL
jgi:uncharacterized membrane protein YfcA